MSAPPCRVGTAHLAVLRHGKLDFDMLAEMSSLGWTVPVESGPDWATIAQEIRCPLCDYNLRGLSEPRCPECGLGFEWSNLLDPAKRVHPYLFEHHPRRNVRSFFKTLVAGMRPRQFWRTLRPEQHGSLRRLVLYWALVNSFVLLTSIAAILLSMASVARGVLPRSTRRRAPHSSVSGGKRRSGCF